MTVLLLSAPPAGLHSTLAAQQGTSDLAGPRRELASPALPRQPFFSARGAAIGAALGCAVGAVAFYQDHDEPGSARLGRSAAFCVLLSIPGAFFGSISIP
ncbi:MAG TPA: hypothetical protein VGB66_09660 [Longimicrobium sp.]